MNFGLDGKTVLVTAASKGIGKAAAELFIAEGCKVAICSSNKNNIEKAAADIKSSSGIEPLWLVCDINDIEDIEKTVELVNDSYGAIDILVNNCGGPVPGFFNSLDDKKWQQGFEQVLMSAVRFSRLVLPGMKNKNWGRIINVTSLSVKQPVDNLMLSNSFRSGLTAFAKTLSNQIGEFNITVNNVAPGYTLTERLYELAVARGKEKGKTPDSILAEMANEVPLKRIGKPEEIASAIVFLASEPAGYITGSTLAVDGGVIKSTY